MTRRPVCARQFVIHHSSFPSFPNLEFGNEGNIATATGFISGTFKHTDGKAVPFSGVIYQRPCKAPASS